MAKDEKYVVKKHLHFEEWMASEVQDVRFEKRLATESEGWRFVVKEGLKALGRKVPEDE